MSTSCFSFAEIAELAPIPSNVFVVASRPTISAAGAHPVCIDALVAVGSCGPKSRHRWLRKPCSGHWSRTSFHIRISALSETKVCRFFLKGSLLCIDKHRIFFPSTQRVRKVGKGSCVSRTITRNDGQRIHLIFWSPYIINEILDFWLRWKRSVRERALH